MCNDVQCALQFCTNSELALSLLHNRSRDSAPNYVDAGFGVLLQPCVEKCFAHHCLYPTLSISEPGDKASKAQTVA